MSQQPSPNAKSTDCLQARLAVLEASAARWRRASFLSFGLAGLALILSFQSAAPRDVTWRTVRAERIEIFAPNPSDGQASTQTILTLGRRELDGAAELRMLGPVDAEPLAILTTDTEGARLSLRSPKHAEDLGSVVELFAEFPSGLSIGSRGSSDHSSIVMTNAPGITSSVQVTSPDGGSVSILGGDEVAVLSKKTDSMHKVAWMSKLDDGGVVATTGLSSASGNTFMLSNGTSGRVFCTDPEMKQMAELYAATTGSLARVSIMSEKGETKPAAVLATSSSGGFVAACSPSGVPMALIKGGSLGGGLHISNNPSDDMDKGGAFVVEPGKSGPGVKLVNLTNESVVTLNADEYGNGVVGAWDRKGQGRTLQPNN